MMTRIERMVAAAAGLLFTIVLAAAGSIPVRAHAAFDAPTEPATGACCDASIRSCAIGDQPEYLPGGDKNPNFFGYTSNPSELCGDDHHFLLPGEQNGCCAPLGSCSIESTDSCGLDFYSGDGTTCASFCPQCADANYDGKVTAVDALFALRAAVGSFDCPLSACDFDGGGDVTATDALAILRDAVGGASNPMCPNMI